MDQPVPKVSREDVERVVRRDFPTGSFSEVLAILDGYGLEDYHQEKARVQLAVLKLADGSLEKLRREIEEAKCDFRDVLSAAEYPAYPWDAHKLPPQEQKRIIDSDWKQYAGWLNR
jgi:hypothetical protein